MTIQLDQLSEKEILEAVTKQRRRVEAGRSSGAKRFEGMDAIQRKIETAKPTFSWMKRASLERAVLRLAREFGVGQAADLLDQWGEPGAKVFLPK